MPDIPNNHVVIGQIVGAHGVKGGLKVMLMTEFEDRFEPGAQIFIKALPYKISRNSYHKDQVRIMVDAIRDRNLAEELQWEYVTVPEDQLPQLNEDEVLAKDLIGLKAIDQHGTELGLVESLLPSPAQDLLVIAGHLVPAIPEYIEEVDFDARTIKINTIPGLFGD